MALRSLRWLENVTGLDICGEAERQAQLQAGREVEVQHVSGDGDSDEVLACDQILTFMERQLWKVQDAVDRATLEEMLDHKRQYVNSLNGAAFQNGQIAMLLEELTAVRFRYAQTRTAEDKLKIVNLKLDISDRLASRHNKAKEGRAHADVLRRMITDIQLQHCQGMIREGGINASADPITESSNASNINVGNESAADGGEAQVRGPPAGGGGGLVRRRFIPDSEIRNALKKRAHE
eukprot:TRINITY_DN73131_c0_g1_i1.p1 TRINITY_DN73131_c0_g1~~TRINITY_DN73131_c0_g1_i1.p1  ORF type:complete len:236 (+),score=62.90 TRINITY_DN73131_c0_g1_i1:43-750(+)